MLSWQMPPNSTAGQSTVRSWSHPQIPQSDDPQPDSHGVYPTPTLALWAPALPGAAAAGVRKLINPRKKSLSKQQPEQKKRSPVRLFVKPYPSMGD